MSDQLSSQPSSSRAALDYEYALLAADVTIDDPDVRSEVNARGWVEGEVFENDTPGYSARIYRNAARNEMIMSYRGTNMTSPADWFNNMAQAIPGFGDGCGSDRARLDAGIASDIAQQENMTLHFVGHSLGGGLATAAALQTSEQATTFNAAGLNAWVAATSQDANFITNYRIRGDILSTMQTPCFLDGRYQIPALARLIGSLRTPRTTV